MNQRYEDRLPRQDRSNEKDREKQRQTQRSRASGLKSVELMEQDLFRKAQVVSGREDHRELQTVEVEARENPLFRYEKSFEQKQRQEGRAKVLEKLYIKRP